MEPQRRASKVELRCQRTEVEPVGLRTGVELEERWSQTEPEGWRDRVQRTEKRRWLGEKPSGNDGGRNQGGARKWSPRRR